MNPKQIATFALKLPETSEEQPFGPSVDVYKVAGKIFVILSPESTPPGVSLKCDPLLALELREEFPAVTPGYHLNKAHWNTVALDGSVPTSEIKNMIVHSYEQVVAGMPKKFRDKLTISSLTFDRRPRH
jgi:predicted DNA-binding protein (MmcQ/YjbR family)